jgi:curved DNA-binding protein CbpA
MFGGIPFEHFAHGGHGGGGGGRAPRGDVDTTKLYETLEVEKDVEQKEIKKAYRKLSRTHHPDKGGDEHKFKEINAAYEILSDPEKRAMYDKYGLEVRVCYVDYCLFVVCLLLLYVLYCTVLYIHTYTCSLAHTNIYLSI